MSWIKTIPYQEAAGALKKLYDRVKGPNDKIDNVLSIHSLRPHTLTAHMGMYKAVIHHSGNSLPKWYLETLGVYVSQLNQCFYCVDHHSEGLKKLLADDEKFDTIIAAMKKDQPQEALEGKWLAGTHYAKQLTQSAHTVNEQNIKALTLAGFSDGEVLEINQLTSYFCYVNRTVLGLGVDTKGDILGLSPNDNQDPNNWAHG